MILSTMNETAPMETTPIVELSDACVHFAIFEPGERSFRKKMIQVATGGHLTLANTGHVVVQALSHVSFQFREGERVAIVGHNGAGKSTLLSVLARIYKPASGTAVITGKVTSLMNITLGTDVESTGRENILLRGAFLGIPRKVLMEKMEEIIEFTDLGDFIDLPLRTYSTGMNMRLAFAVATLLRPEILLMDEWLSVGDEAFRKKAEKRIEEMLETTKLLVIATHSKDLVMRRCTRVIWLEHGHVKMDGAPDEVVPHYFGK
jgi:lipopolysaccharide transport system ATP-binding protein